MSAPSSSNRSISANIGTKRRLVQGCAILHQSTFGVGVAAAPAVGVGTRVGVGDGAAVGVGAGSVGEGVAASGVVSVGEGVAAARAGSVGEPASEVVSVGELTLGAGAVSVGEASGEPLPLGVATGPVWHATPNANATANKPVNTAALMSMYPSGYVKAPWDSHETPG